MYYIYEDTYVMIFDAGCPERDVWFMMIINCVFIQGVVVRFSNETLPNFSRILNF